MYDSTTLSKTEEIVGITIIVVVFIISLGWLFYSADNNPEPQPTTTTSIPLKD